MARSPRPTRAATAQALIWLALGLPAHVLVKALSPAFFAREDTMTPLLATLKGSAVAIVLAVLLGHLFGARGIAAAIALGAWSNALRLIRARRCDLRIFDRCRGAPAAAAHRRGGAGDGRAAVAWRRGLLPVAATAHGSAQAALLAPDRRRIAIYGLFLALFGVTGWREVVTAIRQNRAARLARARPAWQTTRRQSMGVHSFCGKHDHGDSLNGFFQASSRRAICISAIISARSSIS